MPNFQPTDAADLDPSPPTGNELPILTERWARVDNLTRLFYLESCLLNLKRVAPFWIEEEAELRGHAPKSEAGAESWVLGPLPVARTLRYLMHGLQSGGRPVVPSLKLRVDGRSICRIFPFGFHEGILFWGYQGHVWSVGTELQGHNFRQARDYPQGPALVLGASNVSSISATDVLCKLFCENRPVVCLVPNRFASLLPIFNEIFYPLVRDRHVHFLTGGAEEGQKLLKNPAFDTVHLTGSLETYRKIQSQNSFPDRSFTAELGCVTPFIVTPGSWKDKEIAYQARHLVSLLTINGGYNCVTPQVVLVAKDWPQKEALLQAVRAELSKAERRDDRFPGAEEKRRGWRRDYPQGEQFGPRTLVEVDGSQSERIFTEEAFCGMLAWVELDAAEPVPFLSQAVNFCNERLWGDLSCHLIIHPLTQRDHELAYAHALSDLYYGTVSVNVFSGLGFASSVTPWGSYRGGDTDTGTGWVHNTFFFDGPEKSVMEGPFMPAIPPPWIKPFPHLFEVGKALLRVEMDPSQINLLKVFRAYGRSALRRQRRR